MLPSSDKSQLPFLHRHHLLLKTHYFLFFSSFGIIFPILNLTLRSHGLSNTEISFSNFILPFLVFFTSPLIGVIADKSRRFILTFNLLLLLVILTMTTLFFLPRIRSHHIQANLHPGPSSSYLLDFCASQEVVSKCSSRSECGCTYQAHCVAQNQTLNFSFTMNSYTTERHLYENEYVLCDINYQVSVENLSIGKYDFPLKCQITCSIPHFCHGLRYDRQMVYVLLYAIFYTLGANFLSIGNVLTASIGFASLPRADLFGKQRVWGTIGFGIAAFSASRFYEYFHSEYVYIIMFVICALLTILITCFIPIRTVEKATEKKQAKFGLSALIPLLKKVDVWIFLSITFVWGMNFGCLQPYLGLYIDEITPCHSRSIIGWMLLIAASSEVIAFYVARRVIQFLGSNLSSIVIFLAFAIRFGGYYFLPQPFLYLPIETLHFFNYGILYVLISEKADAIAPAGLSGTLQGIAHGITHGLGRGVGLLVSSFIYIVIHQRLLFLVFATINLLAVIIYSIYFCFTRQTANENLSVEANANIIMLEADSGPLPSSSMLNNN
ncbi:unnamed protein product [Adineta ricciae]|uniref:Major facilitator superfamily associated domain-containing protein n=1 Tax=Adineta ricciae TaxID=249248 RepID=A0A814AXA6_ADIRI|nr:unnamed protein product [Adineta ricciae]